MACRSRVERIWHFVFLYILVIIDGGRRGLLQGKAADAENCSLPSWKWISSVQCVKTVTPNLTCQHSHCKHFVSCRKWWYGPLKALLKFVIIHISVYWAFYFCPFCMYRSVHFKHLELYKGTTPSERIHGNYRRRGGERSCQHYNEPLTALLNTLAVSNCHILYHLSFVSISLLSFFPVKTNLGGLVHSEIKWYKWFLIC